MPGRVGVANTSGDTFPRTGHLVTLGIFRNRRADASLAATGSSKTERTRTSIVWSRPNKVTRASTRRCHTDEDEGRGSSPFPFTATVAPGAAATSSNAFARSGPLQTIRHTVSERFAFRGVEDVHNLLFFCVLPGRYRKRIGDLICDAEMPLDFCIAFVFLARPCATVRL